MNNYHISEDGEVRVCTAATPETCTAVSIGGEKSKHFNSREDAEKYAEEKLSELHGQVFSVDSDKIVVSLDMDNTLVDFTDGLRRFMAEKKGLSREESLQRYPEPTNYDFSKGDTPWFSDIGDFLENFREAEEKGLYRELESYSGAIQVVKSFLDDERVDLRVVTARDERYNHDSAENLKKLGIEVEAGEIYNLPEKEEYPAHIFIDDKDDFVERIQSGKYVMPDGITKHVIVPERGYNQEFATAKNWVEIEKQLSQTVDRMLAEKEGR